MAILDTIFRALLSRLIFRSRKVERLSGPRPDGSGGDRRLYAASANQWGLEAPKPATCSFLDPDPEDGGGEEPAPSAASAPRGRRFGLPPATAVPAPSGLLACGAVDPLTRRFSDRR